MKKVKFSWLFGELLVFGLISLIIFLTVPDVRLPSPMFKVAFSLAVPINFVFVAALTIWGFRPDNNGLVHQSAALALAGMFGVAYLALGVVFMYLPINTFTLFIILTATVSVAYVLAILYFLVASSRKTIKEKVLFIRLLQADVLDCAGFAKKPECVSALNTLAEKVRFSDPMSHPTLAAAEEEMVASVGRIRSMLIRDPMADVSDDVRVVEAMLESRNRRCLALK